ncbi:peptidase M23 [Psychromonas sp. psych-6C06]|nr:peptidase M23 [Psychromonas sp. psych-6C06]
MLIRALAICLSILSIVACSSSTGPAPVSDITNENKKSGSKFAVKSKAVVQKRKISQKTYTVKKGDTLYSIAWRAGLSVDNIIDYNALSEPYIIKVGQLLQLSGNKQAYAKKVHSKSDLSSQNVNKNSKSACTAQKCQKNETNKVAQEKSKAYPATKTDKKAVKNKNKNKILSNEKVSDWLWPVKGQLTKRFSASPSGLQGISIVNQRGSAIYAAAAGQVVYSGSGLRGYGNLIIIKHNYDYLSAYAHNETLFVRENELIKMGQKIATMGESGTDHVHLHFEIRYRGKSVDPLRYLPQR